MPAPTDSEYAPGSFGEQNANANKGIYDKGSFAQQSADANKGVYEKGSFADQNATANKPSVPDVNPADRAIARLLQLAAHTAPLPPGREPATREAQFDGRIRRLEDLMTGLLESLNGATIAAACNEEDSTITVTLTFPDLPGA